MEKHIGDYWNVDGERGSSDAWTGFTRFILLNERPPDGGTHGSGGDLQENKEPLVLTMYGQICGNLCPMQRKRKQNKDGLSRNQSSTMPDSEEEYTFIEPDDEEFKVTIKAARRKLEVPMPAAMPCKIPVKSSGETHRKIGKRMTNMLALLMPTRARDQG